MSNPVFTYEVRVTNTGSNMRLHSPVPLNKGDRIRMNNSEGTSVRYYDVTEVIHCFDEQPMNSPAHNRTLLNALEV